MTVIRKSLFDNGTKYKYKLKKNREKYHLKVWSEKKGKDEPFLHQIWFSNYVSGHFKFGHLLFQEISNAVNTLTCTFSHCGLLNKPLLNNQISCSYSGVHPRRFANVCMHPAQVWMQSFHLFFVPRSFMYTSSSFSAITFPWLDSAESIHEMKTKEKINSLFF